MLKIDVIAGGRMRDRARLDLWQDYTKRLQWPLTLHEIESKKPQDLSDKFQSKLTPGAFLFVLDETGKSLGSRQFADKLNTLAATGRPHVQFMIGGADGLPETIIKKADFVLSFGVQTWPHMLVRIMLAEQLYRARQIIAGHPYHRD